MSTDGIQNLGGDSELIDEALNSNPTKEDRYILEDNNDSEEVTEEEDDDDDDDSVMELGMEINSNDEDTEETTPSLEDLKAKAVKEWEKEIGVSEVIDDPVRMYLRDVSYTHMTLPTIYSV